MFDKLFLYLSLYFRYENFKQDQHYPIRSKHYYAFSDSSFVRIDIHHLLSAFRSIRGPSDGRIFIRVQCKHTVLHCTGIYFHHQRMALPDRKVQGSLKSRISIMVHRRNIDSFIVRITIHRTDGQRSYTIF